MLQILSGPVSFKKVHAEGWFHFTDIICNKGARDEEKTGTEVVTVGCARASKVKFVKVVSDV